jgi:hypothetical protein
MFQNSLTTLLNGRRHIVGVAKRLLGNEVLERCESGSTFLCLYVLVRLSISAMFWKKYDELLKNEKCLLVNKIVFALGRCAVNHHSFMLSV